MNREDKIDLIQKWHFNVIHQFGQDEEAEGKALKVLYEAIVDGTLDTFLAEFVDTEILKQQAEIATIEREKIEGSKKEIALQEEITKLEDAKTKLKKK